MRNKVCVLCIDALDYYLVKKFLLKNLMQKEYGKVNLPLKKGEDPKTPIMWSSFFTGKKPKDLGIEGLDTIKKSFGFSWKIQRFLKKIGLKKILLEALSGFNFAIKSHHNFDTIFDKVERAMVISMPNYNEDLTNFVIRNRIYDVLEGTYSPERFEKLIIRAFNRKRKKLFKNLDKDYNLIMMHIFLLDAVSHAFFKSIDKIKYYYKMINSFVNEVSDKIGNDTLLLIVSDHGCKKGLHTNYAFYSSNKKLGLKNPKLTDFHNIILNSLK